MPEASWCSGGWSGGAPPAPELSEVKMIATSVEAWYIYTIKIYTLEKNDKQLGYPRRKVGEEKWEKKFQVMA